MVSYAYPAMGNFIARRVVLTYASFVMEAPITKVWINGIDRTDRDNISEVITVKYKVLCPFFVDENPWPNCLALVLVESQSNVTPAKTAGDTSLEEGDIVPRALSWSGIRPEQSEDDHENSRTVLRVNFPMVDFAD